MAASTPSGLQIAFARPCVSASCRVIGTHAAVFNTGSRRASWAKLTSACSVSSILPFHRKFSSCSFKSDKGVIKAMAEASDKAVGGLPIDLRGFISIHYA